MSCTLHVEGSGEVNWHIAAPSGDDLAGMSSAEIDAGGLMQGSAVEPLLLIVEGCVDRNLIWNQLAVVGAFVG